MGKTNNVRASDWAKKKIEDNAKRMPQPKSGRRISFPESLDNMLERLEKLERGRANKA